LFKAKKPWKTKKISNPFALNAEIKSEDGQIKNFVTMRAEAPTTIGKAKTSAIRKKPLTNF
jgi:hypothetical protein